NFGFNYVYNMWAMANAFNSNLRHNNVGNLDTGHSRSFMQWLASWGSNNESFPMFITDGPGRTDPDPGTRDKLKPGDKIFIVENFLAPSTFPSGGTWGKRFSGFAESIKNMLEFTGSKSTMKSHDTIVSLMVPIGTKWVNGKATTADSLMNFKTPIRHPSYYRNTMTNGYDMFNEDIGRQMDSVWDARKR